MWSIDPKTFPKKEGIEEQIKFILRYSILAPSIYNTQPWKFEINKNKITIFPDHSRTLKEIDKDKRGLWTSIGSLLENLIITAERFGFTVKHSIKEKEIKITLKESKRKLNPLFEQITKRAANKRKSKRTLIPNKELKKLQNTKFISGTNALLIDKKEDLHKIAQLVKLGNQKLYSNKKIIYELLYWTRFNKSKIKKHNDGLTYKSIDIPESPTKLGQIIMSFFLKPNILNKEIEDKLKNSSGLIIITSKNDTKKDWINTGRTLERLLLTLTSFDMGYDFVNQACQPKVVRKKLQRITKDIPQIMLRIGHAKKSAHSPRRELKEFLKTDKK